MTTKWKIVSGFVVMVILVGIVLLIGYRGIQTSSENFEEYRRLARLNVATSDLGAALNSATTNIRTYIDTYDENLITSARNDSERFLKLLEDNQQFALQESTLTTFTSLKKGIIDFMEMTGNVQKSVTQNARQYRDVVLPSLIKMAGQLDFMTDAAEKTDNASALATFSHTWSELSKFMSAISRFANTRTMEDAKTAREYLDLTGAKLADFQRVLPSEAGHKDFNNLKEIYDNLTNAFITMEKSSVQLRTELEGINTFLQTTSQATDALSKAINAQMVEFGQATLASNASTQNRMLTAGGIGFFFGIFIALVIVIGIIRVLKDLSGFAGAIAAGDFSRQIRSREKGEIGGMVTAMREIPVVLEQIITTVNSLSNNIRLGELRNRFDVTTLPGTFANLGTAVNTLSGAYTDLIDAMPLPVGTCDKDLHIIYANRKAASILGDRTLSLTCRDQTGGGYTAENCLGKSAMQAKETRTEEFAISPQGVHMDVSATAIPLFNEHGEALAFIEIITDLTEIKAKQATMLSVANEASVISDRVAAASEELATQVEEISQGAEMQRQRVESTASAMNEMNSTVLEVARNASEASEQSEGTRSMAENGAELVNKVVIAINKVQEVGDKMHGNMQELGLQAESIGGVMNVISDIADQTNLLALNAAIEAARAGEAGRGFAVVADEVRKLAEKTMEATQEVGANITAIQHSARVNIEEVNNAVRSVGEATGLAHSSGEALHEIVNLAGANSTIVASIATAAEEQSATSEEINTAVAEINRITQETTDGMVQSSEAVQELSRMAQELRRVMEGLR